MKNKKISWLIMLMILLNKITVYADGIETGGGTSCSDILGAGLTATLKDNFFTPLKFIAPLLLLVVTTIDFVKIIFSDNKDGMQKAWKNFLKRAIATLIVFFASNIVAFILGFTEGKLCFGF